MSPYKPRIAIIGSGPGGLTLGRLLYKAGVQATIFEARSKPTDEDYDKPCGMLDLHEESGLNVVRRCGLWDEFMALTGDCAEDIKIYDHDGELLHHYRGSAADGARPEISRLALTRLLEKSLPSDMIRWEHKVVGVEAAASTAEDGRVEMVVDFGQVHGKQAFDFVVGADGAWSKVRRLLTAVKPSYVGMHFMTLDMLAARPDQSEFLGQGSMTSLAFRNGIIGQRAARGATRFYLMVSTPDENFATTSGFGNKTAAEAAPALVEDAALFGRWAQSFKDLITAACTSGNNGDRLDIRPMYVLPVTHAWDTKPGVTVVGDAAHLMQPFAGEGVNLAMWDSLDLSDVIIKAVESSADGGSLDFQRAMLPLVEEFEKKMMVRAHEKMEETSRNHDVMFGSETGSADFAAMFQNMGWPGAAKDETSQ
ncbi:hypothetical protein E4U41_001511 [Claviceps citrina]|nr:hypothetical protein E4U41_001511 [Claviceps citrina]